MPKQLRKRLKEPEIEVFKNVKSIKLGFDGRTKESIIRNFSH